MLFASTDLAARIERSECRMLTDGAHAVRRRRPGAEVFVRELAGGVATLTGAGSPLNKLAGLGFGGALDEGELAEVEQVFHARGLTVRAEVSTLADPSIGALLTARGYRLVGFENVLGRELPLEPSGPRAPGVEIEPSDEAGLAQWLDIVVTGFLTPDTQGVASSVTFPRAALEEVIGDMAASARFERFLAKLDGLPAGGGSLRLFEGVALLCGASTLPEHRRRGVQSTLLAARLELAGRAGCDVAAVTTQPGSKSAENVQRKGFELLYARAVLEREP